jgi:hypothetical protein
VNYLAHQKKNNRLGPCKRDKMYNGAELLTRFLFNTRLHEVKKQYCVFQSYLQYSQRDALYLERNQ